MAFDESMIINTDTEKDKCSVYGTLGAIPNETTYDNCISGNVIGSSNDCEYKRNLVIKAYEKFFYRASMSDTLNCITVKCSNNGIDTISTIDVYGKISGGVQRIRTGSSIVAYGKRNNKNRFVANKLIVDGCVLSVQKELADIMPYILLAVLIGSFILAMQAKKNGMSVSPRLSTLVIMCVAGLAWLKSVFYKIKIKYIRFKQKIKLSIIGIVIVAVVLLLLLGG